MSPDRNVEKQTADDAATYPGCPVIERTLQIGGETKAELLTRLEQNGVELNEAVIAQHPYRGGALHLEMAGTPLG